MPRVLMVDWLGRGGIAQATEAWAIELGDRRYHVEVVTRPGRELGGGLVPTIASRERRGRIAAHRAVVQTAAQQIRDVRPDCVIVQNYVVPPLERPVYEAARAAGSRLVVVVHDDRLHAWRAGTAMGLGRNLRLADVVAAHSDHVARRVGHDAKRSDVVVLPLPVPIGMLWHSRGPRPEQLPDNPDARWCGHFGVVHRRYKGTSLVEQLAREGAEGWDFAVFGAGAQPGPGLHVLPGYLDPGELVAAVSTTDVTLAPYTYATQSAVVVLAHALGSVPVASAIGGIPEQLIDGVDGLLLKPGAGVDAWRDALHVLRDDDHRKELAIAGENRAWADHADSVAGLSRFLW
jgi:glycosyltransferase involved in cell wall biosynthesis